MNTPNYSIYLYLRKTRPNKDNKFPVYVRIRIDNEKMEFPSGQFVFESNWDAKKQKAVKFKESSTVNGMLDAVKVEINQTISQLFISKSCVSIDNIRKLLKNEVITEKKSFLSVVEEHNTQFESMVGKKYSYGSYKNYKTTFKYLTEFIPKSYGKKDIALTSVNYKFCEAYFSYLTTEKDCHVNGANKQIQRIKKIINYAIKLGYLQTNPMASYSLEFTPVSKVALKIEEIESLGKLNLSRQVLRDVRDVFMVQCYTGLSYSDIKLLSKSHISINPDGTSWIRMKRQKTSVAFAVPLLQPALLIMNKYLETTDDNLPLLPVISNQKMNENLKVLQELAGISKNLTSHLARHSFATAVTLNNGVPISTVSRMLGHTKLSTTQIYAKVLENTIEDDMKILSGRLAARNK